MFRLITVLVVLFCIFAHEKKITEGCHAGHSQEEDEDYDDYDDDDDGLIEVEGENETEVSNGRGRGRRSGRSKRQVEQYGDDFTVLREYFRECMMDRVPDQWDWKSIMDFTVLQTLWFLYSGTVACTEENGKDNAECWNDCIDVYMISSSELIKPAKECVRQYEADFKRQKASYSPTFRRGAEKAYSPPQGKYLQCVQAQYNEADPESLFRDTGRLSFSAEAPINVNSVVQFIRGHVKCVICDFNELPSGLRKPDFRENSEINGAVLSDGTVVYTTTWPFSFEALVRRDARLRLSINFCNQEFEVTLRKDPPPNPGWTQWYIWNNCDAACGRSGIQKRSRVCLDENEGNCPGKRSQERVCHNKDCAYWSTWGPYTPCLSTCGVSEKYSFRTCMKGKTGEKNCRGPQKRVKSCAVGSCIVSWSQWSACSKTCGMGGIQTRTGGGSLIHMRTENRSCSLGKCPEQWSQWSPWGPCSKTCGIGGTRERIRRCLSKNCVGQARQSTSCGKPPCKEGWGEWARWSDCSYRRRTRVCVNGVNCPGGKDEDYQRCFSIPTPTISTVPTVGPTLRWTQWSQWSECDCTCGHGWRRRFRNCQAAVSAFPRRCSGQDTQSEQCSKLPCPKFGQSICHDSIRKYCRQSHMNCGTHFGKNWCRKTCGYC